MPEATRPHRCATQPSCVIFISAFAEARRVLRPGGTFVCNVWDRIEVNEFADCVTQALKQLFPSDPPQFLARIPHGYHDQSAVAEGLERGSFDRPAEFHAVAARSRAESSRSPAIAYCQGTPLRSEIEARDRSRLAEATDIAAAELASRFGKDPLDGQISAHVVSVTR